MLKPSLALFQFIALSDMPLRQVAEPAPGRAFYMGMDHCVFQNCYMLLYHMGVSVMVIKIIYDV